MLNLKDYNAFCKALPATTSVVQWGGAHVWKVGAKVFAIASDSGEEGVLAVTFKVSPLVFEMLRDAPGLRPAPYLATRGMTWIQHYALPGLDDAALKSHIAESHRIVSLGLTKALQKKLGLNQP